VHLSLLNQQLSSLGNSSSVQAVVKVLVDDTTYALKNGDISKAILHLELIQQQFGSKASPKQTNVTPKNQVNDKIATKTESPSAPPILDNIYNFYTGGSTPYPIKYKITGTNNKLTSISQGLSRHELLLNFNSESAGKLIVEFPRNVIDTKKQNSPFQVLIEGKKGIFQEITNNSQTRTLAFDFPAGIVAGHIEVIGGRVVQPPAPKIVSSEPSFFTPSQGTYSSEQSSVPFISPPPEEPTDILNANVVDLNINGMKFPIKYDITGNGNSLIGISLEANTITYDPNDYSLVVSIDAQSNGKLTIELPRNIIDSEGPYNVVYNGHASSANEVKNNAKVRTLNIDFQQGTNQIEIQGGEIFARISDPYMGSRGGVAPSTQIESPSEPNTDHHVHTKSKRGEHDQGGPVGGYDTGFAVGVERANEAVDQFDNGQLKGIDADKSPPCPAVDEGNGYCRGFHDGWRKTVLDRLD
jgi:hypothetical protein